MTTSTTDSRNKIMQPHSRRDPQSRSLYILYATNYHQDITTQHSVPLVGLQETQNVTQTGDDDIQLDEYPPKQSKICYIPVISKVLVIIYIKHII